MYVQVLERRNCLLYHCMSHVLYTLKVEYGVMFSSPTLLTYLFIPVSGERNSFLYKSLKDLLVSVFSSACPPI